MHKNISLNAHAGECLTLSGSSGSGKTRLLRYLADLEEFQGELVLDDRPCSDYEAPLWRRRVALLPTENTWWFETIGEHFPRPPADEQFTQLGLEPGIMNKRADDTSSGERQRLALLRMLMNEPQVLLLDEPTANLDEENKLRVEQMVLRYLKEHQACALWTTHDRQQIRRISSRHYRLVDGELHEEPIP